MRACVRACSMRAPCVRVRACVRAGVLHPCVRACLAWRVCVFPVCVLHACVRACMRASGRAPSMRACVRAGMLHPCVRACVHACVQACVFPVCVLHACVRVCVHACVRLREIIHMYMKPKLFLISHLNVFLYTMDSFKCSKCSYNTIRNYDLTRHLKRVHGIYVNTSFKGDNQLQAGLPSQMFEEKHSGERQQPRMELEDSEEEESPGNEPRTNPKYTEEQIERLRAAMRRKKYEILDCVLNILPLRLKPEAKRICDSTKENNLIFINDKHEVIIRGEIQRESNI